MFRGSLICFLLVLLPLLAAGQAPGFSPKLLPSSVTVYDIDRGLPISCMDDVYIGPKGQLWINPCRNQDIYQNLSFYAYDGEKANIISLEAPGVKAGSRGWYLNGQLSRQTQLDAFFKQVSFPSICGVSFVKDLQENILVTLSSCFSLQLSLHHAR
ncbi:MAG: hypothetical protein H6574_14020 [Lewinellaceae bacterium]|nr:hypothetical protein [Saprospiraceae bacterium]MCB9332196.1 hypothetical protein [Lewinellaceae bacterium]